MLLAFLAACGQTLQPPPNSVPPTTGIESVTQTPLLTAPIAPTATSASLTPAPAASLTLLVSNSAANYVSFVDLEQGVIDQVTVGEAPWGIALGPNDRAYVSTAEGVAVVDVGQRQRLALVPYWNDTGEVQYGEYRPGGMGLASAPDGSRIYVGVYLPSGLSQLEVLDAQTLEIIASVPIGIRPFEVLITGDGNEILTVDHDSYTITAVNPATLTARTLEVAPLGRGAFDKPHYATRGSDGRLWLPYQGKTLIRLDVASGQYVAQSLTADTHQHGVALTPDERYLLIVGTGAAGGAMLGPSLTLFDTLSNTDEVLPLDRPHEKITISPDGRLAFLTGGYLLAGGWDGLTIFDIQSRTFTELPVPDRPQDIVILSPK